MTSSSSASSLEMISCQAFQLWILERDLLTISSISTRNVCQTWQTTWHSKVRSSGIEQSHLLISWASMSIRCSSTESRLSIKSIMTPRIWLLLIQASRIRLAICPRKIEPTFFRNRFRTRSRKRRPRKSPDCSWRISKRSTRNSYFWRNSMKTTNQKVMLLSDTSKCCPNLKK